MNGKTVARARVLLLAVALAGCGGDDGGKSNATELKSEADIAREIGTITAYLNSTSPGGVAKPAESGARSSSLKPRYAVKIGEARSAARSKRSPPKAAEQFDCSTGFSIYEPFEEQARTLPLFAISETMDYEVEDFHDCVFTSGESSLSTDGHTEDGDNYDYSDVTVANPYYDYFISGSGNTPVDFGYNDAEGGFVVSVLGRSETRDNGLVAEFREVVDLDFEVTTGNESFSASVRSGTNADPFTTTFDYGSETFTVDGPFTYSSDFCDGGTVRYTTVEPITFGSDEAGEFPNGGQVKIASGGASVTVTFQLDGGATYEFSNGSTGSMTREELESATPCVFTL